MKQNVIQAFLSRRNRAIKKLLLHTSNLIIMIAEVFRELKIYLGLQIKQQNSVKSVMYPL